MANKLAEVLEFIKNYPYENSLTDNEIAKGIGLSNPETVHNYLYLLEQQGYISYDHNSTRKIRVLK